VRKERAGYGLEGWLESPKGGLNISERRYFQSSLGKEKPVWTVSGTTESTGGCSSWSLGDFREKRRGDRRQFQAGKVKVCVKANTQTVPGDREEVFLRRGNINDGCG